MKPPVVLRGIGPVESVGNDSSLTADGTFSNVP